MPKIAETSVKEISKQSSNLLNILNLGFCVAGIYACFLTWALLQERLSTTNYKGSKFSYFVFLNACQSLVCAIWAWVWLRFVRGESLVVPNRLVAARFCSISVSSSVASPFGYMSLSHINYPTHMLAKSCKLVPVMFVGVLLHRRSYPFYKYVSVALVTIGVSAFMFLLPHKAGNDGSNSMYGVFLVLINMLLDGYTGSTQDEMFRKKEVSTGSQMMLWMNLVSFLLMMVWILNPWNPEFLLAVEFCRAAFPEVVTDIILFCVCGALGQTFVFHSLSTFGSITLVTITVTRKLFTIVLSCVFYGHAINQLQWCSIGVVFAGIMLEAMVSAMSKEKKAEKKDA